MKGKLGLLPTLLAAIIGIAVIWAGNHFGLWWITMLVGLAIGVVLRGTWATLIAAALAAVGGWGLDLLWQSRQVDIGGVASVIAGILGLGQPFNTNFGSGGVSGTPEFGASNGYIVILLTLVLALLLALAGTWAGAALRRAVLVVQGIRSGAAFPQASDAAVAEAAPVAPVEG